MYLGQGCPVHLTIHPTVRPHRPRTSIRPDSPALANDEGDASSNGTKPAIAPRSSCLHQGVELASAYAVPSGHRRDDRPGRPSPSGSPASPRRSGSGAAPLVQALRHPRDRSYEPRLSARYPCSRLLKGREVSDFRTATRPRSVGAYYLNRLFGSEFGNLKGVYDPQTAVDHKSIQHIFRIEYVASGSDCG